MTFMLEAAVTRKVMKPEDRRFFNGNPRFRCMPCRDHNGRAFSSAAERAKFWKLPEFVVAGRLRRGWDLEKALTSPIGYRFPRHPCEDHEGRKFDSAAAMCEYWGISYNTYCGRRKKGMSVQRALTAPIWYQQKERKA